MVNTSKQVSDPALTGGKPAGLEALAARRLPYPPPPTVVLHLSDGLAAALGKLAGLCGLTPGETAAVLLDDHPLETLLPIRQSLDALHQRRLRDLGASAAQAGPLREEDGAESVRRPRRIRVPLSRELSRRLFDLGEASGLASREAAAEILARMDLAQIAEALAANRRDGTDRPSAATPAVATGGAGRPPSNPPTPELP